MFVQILLHPSPVILHEYPSTAFEDRVSFAFPAKMTYKERVMKIGVKLVVGSSIVSLINTGLVAGITLIQSQQEINRLAKEQAQTIDRENSEKIRNWLGKYMDVSQTIAQNMEGYKDIAVAERRGYVDMKLNCVIAGNIEALGTWANWDPICLTA